MIIYLPKNEGTKYAYQIPELKIFETSKGLFNRVAYAAAHVVPKKGSSSEVDWAATLAYRHKLWTYGLGVAEAMDTAQRGSGLTYQNAKELIKRSIEASRMANGALLASGCGTDQLLLNSNIRLNSVIDAYLEQIEFVEELDGKIIIMASRALAICAKSPDDYVKVYSTILNKVKNPVIIHWLGEMFDQNLTGYWGSKSHDEAMIIVHEIISKHAEKVDGIKISLLDKKKEITLRNMLPKNVKIYTGDDFNYVELLAGDNQRYSDALLGIFGGIAPAASAALYQLSKGNVQGFYTILNPTVPLSQHIFAEPTQHYKTGLVFLSWLNGFQNEFKMLDNQETARSKYHLAETFRLACEAGVLVDMKLAYKRANWYFENS